MATFHFLIAVLVSWHMELKHPKLGLPSSKLGHWRIGLTSCLNSWCFLSRNSKLREQAIEVLRDLLASHDSDTRYNSPEARARIASIYLPLLSITMDNFQHLYKGADGWEDWTTTFERNTEVRRSVVIREGVDGSWEMESPAVGGLPQQMQTSTPSLPPSLPRIPKSLHLTNSSLDL